MSDKDIVLTREQIEEASRLEAIEGDAVMELSSLPIDKTLNRVSFLMFIGLSGLFLFLNSIDSSVDFNFVFLATSILYGLMTIENWLMNKRLDALGNRFEENTSQCLVKIFGNKASN